MADCALFAHTCAADTEDFHKTLRSLLVDTCWFAVYDTTFMAQSRAPPVINIAVGCHTALVAVLTQMYITLTTLVHTVSVGHVTLLTTKINIALGNDDLYRTCAEETDDLSEVCRSLFTSHSRSVQVSHSSA